MSSVTRIKDYHTIKYEERHSLICHFQHDQNLPTLEIILLLCLGDFKPATDPLWICKWRFHFTTLVPTSTQKLFTLAMCNELPRCWMAISLRRWDNELGFNNFQRTGNYTHRMELLGSSNMRLITTLKSSMSYLQPILTEAADINSAHLQYCSKMTWQPGTIIQKLNTNRLDDLWKQRLRNPIFALLPCSFCNTLKKQHLYISGNNNHKHYIR